MQSNSGDLNNVKQEYNLEPDCNPIIDQEALFKKYYEDTFGIDNLDYDYIYPKLGGKGNDKKKKNVSEKTFMIANIAKRNARERKRVEQVNNAFAELRKCIPIENRKKRVSKVRTLRVAIEYIKSLSNILEKL